MWSINIISLNNLDIILNFLNNNLLELTILNRQNISAATTVNGIRATQISFAGGVGSENFNINNYETDSIIMINLNFINNELRMLRLNNLVDNINSEDSSTEEYISDEDFSFDRYEWTESDFSYDNSDWHYNSS
jgi:hypothetical protein